MPDLSKFLTTLKTDSPKTAGSTEPVQAPPEPTPPAKAPPAPDLSAELSPSGPALYSPDQLNELRRRILQGEEPSPDEMTVALQSILADRTGRLIEGQEKPKRARTRKAKPTVDLDDMLS